MESFLAFRALRADRANRARTPCIPGGALLLLLWMLPAAARAQDAAATAAAECRAVNVKFADDLLQALSAARSKRSSFTTALKLVPVEAQLKSLKAMQQVDSGSVADCQRVAAQISVEHGRLARLLPEVQVAAAAVPTAAVANVAAAPGPIFAPGSSPGGACAVDNEQTRADLAQRFVHFMQLAQVPSAGLAPYQSFARRLTTLNASMLARPEDCDGHRTTLAQSNIELQQLMAMEARTAPPQGSAAGGSVERPADGAIPLLSSPSTETCVTDLRLGLRDAQQAATGLLMTQPEGSRRTQAQLLLDRVVHQQVDSFSRSPMSAEACDQSRRGLGELRESIRAARDGATQTAARPLTHSQSSAGQAPPQQAPNPAPAPLAQAPAAPSQPSGVNDLRECMDHNRRVYADLDREGNSLKASGKVSAAQSAAFDKQMSDYRDWMRTMLHPIQCGVLAGNMKSHLAMVRQAASSPVAPTAAAAGPAAPLRPMPGQVVPATPAPATAVPSRVGPAPRAPGVQAATAAPSALPAKPAPPTIQPQPARPAAPAAPAVAQRAPPPPAAAPARTPSQLPTKLQGSREAER